MKGERLDEEQVDSPAEGGSGHSGEDFKDDIEVGGDGDNEDEEEDCQGLEHELSEDRAQDGAGIVQGMDGREPEEQRDSKEQYKYYAN